MNQESDITNRILMMFKAYGCVQDALISKQELTRILDTQANNKLGRAFKAQIINEFWVKAESTSRGQCTMHTFASIISRAIEILQERLNRIDSPQNGIPDYQRQVAQKKTLIDQLEVEYKSGFMENYERINLQSKNKLILENKIKELQQHRKNFTRELQEIIACIDAPPPQRPPPDQFRVPQTIQPEIQPAFIQSTPEKIPNPTLLTIFKVTVAGIILELLVLTLKMNFLALLAYALIIYWLFLGYYDKQFVSHLIAALGLSLAFDVIYALLMALDKVHTTHPSSGWLGAVLVIFLVVQLALRVVLMASLFPFRDMPTKPEYFVFMDQQIQLNLRAGKREAFIKG